MNVKPLEDWTNYFLKSYKEEMVRPFPYAGAKKLRRKGGERYVGFIPDLDLFSSTIASYCGGIKKVLSLPDEKLLEAKEALSKSFFEKHPKYKSLEPAITEENTPDLYAWLRLHEEMRVMLLELFSQVLFGLNRPGNPGDKVT
ncbi:MAG: hypothetical protein KIT57_05315 [Blastocatellales bacterium]|nr:hypothetical protein [Blastocatellales bacterium]